MNYDVAQAKSIEDIIDNINNNRSLYTVFKFIYNGNKNLASLQNNSFQYDSQINTFLTFVKENLPAGTNKVKIQLIDLFFMFKKEKRIIGFISKLIVILKGSHEVRFTCTILSIISTLTKEKNTWFELLKFINVDNFIDILKEDHENIRHDESYNIDKNLSMIRCMQLYKHVLNGRVDEELNLKDEMIKRTNGDLCNVKTLFSNDMKFQSEELFDLTLKKHIDLLLAPISVKKVLSIEEFMADYYLKVVGGSYFDEKGTLDRNLAGDLLYELNPNLKMNKRTVGLTNKYNDMLLKLNNIETIKPRLKTKVHQKVQEQTKARSIYQTTMLHYLCCTYLFTPIEEQISTNNIFMNTDSYENLKRTVKRLRMCKEKWINSFDFEDFNAQHSFKHMQTVLLSLVTHISSKIDDQSIRLNYLKIGDWIINAVNNTYTVIEGKVYKWKNGMPTGIRYTSLMNNLLNYLYSKCVYENMNMIRLGKFVNFDNCEVCGDDSWHAFDSKEISDLFNIYMIDCGFSLQLEKQMTSKNMFEFLRLQYYSNGLVAGCINRTISNAVCGNWEDDGIDDPDGIFSEIYSTAISFCKRGMPVDLVIMILKASLTNNYTSRCYEMGSYESYNFYLERCELISSTYDQRRQVEVEKKGLGSLLYGESYKIIENKYKGLEIYLTTKNKLEFEEVNRDERKIIKPCSSINDFVISLTKWISGKIKIDHETELDTKRIRSNCIKLATEGAWKRNLVSNPIKRLADSTKFINLSKSIVVYLTSMNFKPRNKITDRNMNILLVDNVRLYEKYYNNLSKIGVLQSMSAANLDIVKYWLVESALPSNRKNEIFKILFNIKNSRAKSNYITNVKINSKGKFERLYSTNPTLKLLVVAETESILNACYAINSNYDIYRCILIKEFNCQVVSLTMRN